MDSEPLHGKLDRYCPSPLRLKKKIQDENIGKTAYGFLSYGYFLLDMLLFF